AVSAYRLPSASPLTSSCPHGRSVRMSEVTDNIAPCAPSLLRPSLSPYGPHASWAEHPDGALGEVVGDGGLRESTAGSVPAMDPGAGTEERKGRKLGVALDEVALTRAVDDHALEVVAHGLVCPMDLLQRCARKRVLLTHVDVH